MGQEFKYYEQSSTRQESSVNQARDPDRYYAILEVSPNASIAEIKSAYRNLAKQYHPDISQEGKTADIHDRMSKINAAYEILKDPDKKRVYDEGETNKGETNSQQTRPERSNPNQAKSYEPSIPFDPSFFSDYATSYPTTDWPEKINKALQNIDKGGVITKLQSFMKYYFRIKQAS